MSLFSVTSPTDLPGLICIDIAIIVVAARLVGALFRRFGQPAVIGEIITGLLLGPSVLGAFPGNPTLRLFPLAARPTLNVLAQLGVVLFMFIVGLEVDLSLIKGRRRVAGTVSVSSVILPFGLGAALAVYLFDTYRGSGRHLSLLGFALFIGASMSVTAFPVLARILAERRMMTTDLGAFALACAAVDDVTAWTVLAVVVAIVASTSPSQVPLMLIELGAFVAACFLVVRPVLRNVLARERGQTISPTVLAAVLVGLLVSAWITDKIGVNLIFGAFVFGAAMPKESAQPVIAAIVERIESVTLLLLLPLFFVVTGLSVNIRTIGWQGLLDLVLILAVAVGGKFAGASLAARLQGVTTRRSFAIGTLMNTRGLTELVILTVGLHFGVLNRQLFTLLVIMAIVTTLLTGPLFKLFYPDPMLAEDIAESQRKLHHDIAYGVLVVLDDTSESSALVRLGADLAGREGEVLVVQFLPKAAGEGPYSGVSGDLVRMAAAMEELQRLAASIAGVRVRPLAQFSADPSSDLIELARRADVDATLYDETRWPLPTTGALLQDAACDVLSFRSGPQRIDGTVVTLIERQADAEAALEAGVRVSLHAGGGRDQATIRLFPGTPGDAGRCRRVAERLRSLAVAEATVVSSPEEAVTTAGGCPPLLMCGLRHDAGREAVGQIMESWPGPRIAVAGHDDPQRIGLDQRLARLAGLAALRAEAAPLEDPALVGSGITSPDEEVDGGR